MSKWWFEDYKYDSKKNKSYSKGSGSRSWLTKLGGYYSDYDYWKPKKSQDETYQDLLNQLQNSANVVGNSEVGSIKIHWSNGANRNEISNDEVRDIYLSPDNLLTGNEVSEEVLDAMTGKVYLASTLRDTVSPTAYKQANLARNRKEDKIAENAVNIWESLETSIARSKILEDWAGFSPYIAGDAERSSASKKQVQDYINSSASNPNSKAASVAISWNILNSHDPIEVPEVYHPCMEAAASFMEKEIPSEERFKSSQDLAKKIQTLLPSTDEGESKGKDKGKPGPKLCDSSLLGEVVKNETSEELAEQEASDKVEKSDKDNPTNVFNVKPPEGMSDYGKEHSVEPVNVGGSARAQYDSIRRGHFSEIRSIQSSLMFRNTSERLHSYGHRTGEIDENSLFKVFMNDDRVMLRSDVQSKKDIAICLLVDESGSMSRRIEDARNVAIIIGESLKAIDGIEFSIYGHTGEDYHSSHEGVSLREYYSPRYPDMARCMQMSARSENLDSWAIMHTANLFFRDYQDCSRKIMFVISDGQPAGSGYGGNLAYQHMRSVSKACGEKGLEVYGIGIDNAYTPDIGQKMYGENKFVVLKDIRSSLGIMSRFIRQIAMK